MDFYQHQDQARRNTVLLAVLLLLAVLALIAVTVVFTTLFIHYFQLGSGIHLQAAETGQSIWQVWLNRLSFEIIGSVSAVVILTVFLASQFKALQLRKGGEAVAAALDGHLLNKDLANSQHRQLLNVVEEIAIAAGTPVPPTYVFDEPSINAFAAGYRPTDAVIGITQGALDLLNREQLQGVIAHEFSHILHGDMRLNMRLISLISGITVIGSVGYMLMRSSGGGYRSRSSENKRGGLMAFGLGLVVIGFAGTLFGKIITSAASRQREFLADASAVQYTRNPNGIAGALRAIQQNAYGSQWQHAHAVEFGHLFFGQGISGFMSKMFATHPPLDERIARIAPQMTQAQPSTSQAFHAQAETATDMSSLLATTNSDNRTISGLSALAVSAIGPATIAAASAKLEQVPASLASQTNNIFTARALIYGILLSPMSETEKADATVYLGNKSHPAVYKRLNQILSATFALKRDQQWVLLLETLPTLRQLSGQQKSVFMANTKYLVEHDQKVTLFEWCIFELAKQSCQPTTESLFKELAPHRLNSEIANLFSFVAHSNWVSMNNIEQNFDQLTKDFGSISLLDKSAINFRKLSSSVRKLRYLQPLQKPKLLKVVIAIMKQDGKITSNEKILLKTLSLCLDCPIPENL